MDLISALGSMDKVYILRLLPGTDLIQEIEAFARKERIKHGVVLSMLGTLKDGAFRSPSLDASCSVMSENEDVEQIDVHSFDRPAEIVGGTGNLFPKNKNIDVHIHLVVSLERAGTMAGHLVRGTILTRAEIFIAKLSGLENVSRSYDADTGLWQIQVL